MEETNLMNQIAWGVAVFALGMLVGYMLKVVMINYEKINNRKDE